MDIEIHAFPMAGEPVSAPTSQKLLSRLNRSIGKSEGKRIRDRLVSMLHTLIESFTNHSLFVFLQKESPATNMKMYVGDLPYFPAIIHIINCYLLSRAPQYEKLGSLTLDITCIDDSIRSHDITKVILPSSSSVR